MMRKEKMIIKLLVLPESILSWKGVTYNEDVVDDPLDHDGRTRSFKHERDTPSGCLHTWMNAVLDKLPVQGNVVSSPHISLSRTLILKFHWIESFVEGMKLLCRRSNKFAIQLTDVRVYCNEEKTRTFLGIYCQDENGMLKCLTEALDNLSAGYQLPSFYKDTSYHISFFWCLGDKRAYLKEILPSLTSSLNDFLVENMEDAYVHVNEIQCKIGNKCYNFELK
ncbi:U6 snRNA phosphodiesterase 1 isoform X5 [Temnothorax americanus]|uniref:U6 snRNA phosphodiesterase 1 isoform X5 n=1 Tax=Temnothorax americanus TaxID=1964332 RepID=UPI0040682E51